MNKQEKEHIKNLLSSMKVDKAPVDLTDNVMQDIAAFSDEKLLNDANLSTLLQKNIIEKPSGNLVSEVMNSIEVSQSLQFKPLISKKAWIVIFLGLVALVYYSIINETATQTATLLNKVSPYVDQMKGLFDFSFKGFVVSPVLMISIISLFSLLFVDRFIKREVRI